MLVRAHYALVTGREIIGRARKFVTRPGHLVTLFALTETVRFDYLYGFTKYR